MKYLDTLQPSQADTHNEPSHVYNQFSVLILFKAFPFPWLDPRWCRDEREFGFDLQLWVAEQANA